MNLFETNSNRQSIKYYIKEKVPLYLVIQKGIEVECKVIFIKSFMINETDNNIWWMYYIEKENKYCYTIHSYDSKYIALCESEEEALSYMISSLKSIMINVDRKICELSDKLTYISTLRKEGK
jgi:hypothetical protein